jgi:hypothetical protein
MVKQSESQLGKFLDSRRLYELALKTLCRPPLEDLVQG